MEPGLRVESLTEQSAFWPITQWPLELETWILIEDSSPRAAVNNEPWITLGTRTCSSEVFSPNEIGISETVILLYLSIIFFGVEDVSSVDCWAA